MSDQVHAPVGVAAMKERAHKIANLLFRGPTTLEWSGRTVEEWYEHILAKAFAAVAAETREACAKVAESGTRGHGDLRDDDATRYYNAGCRSAAAAIRALATTSPPAEEK